MTLSEIKNAIKVDYTDDDSFIQMCIDSAKEYIDDAVDEGYNEGVSRHNTLLIALVADMYENRNYTLEKDPKMNRVIRSLIAQLNDGW